MNPDQFVTKVVKAYNNNIGIFSKKVNAEDNIPNNLSNKKVSLYLFYVTQLDYATKSQSLYKGAKKLYKNNLRFFSPKYILQIREEELKSVLQKYLKPRYINEAVLRYKLNSQRLIKVYNGNPLNIFKSSKLAIESLEKVYKFRGFGPKIGNFYVRTMINHFRFPYKDIENIMPPVDIHDVRITYLMQFVESKEMNTKNINKVKRIWNKACKKSKVSWLIFDKALWILGSEGKPKTKEDIIRLIHIRS